MDFQVVADCLSNIQATGSTLQKEALLRNYAGIDGFKAVLKFIYDPYFTTGLKQAKLDIGDGIDANAARMSIDEIMRYFREHNTGTKADIAMANGFIFDSADPNWQWAATGLVTKDLQIGVSVTTLNKVYGKGFIPKIGIMRGMLCPDHIFGSYIVTEKIDGNRRLIFTRETGVEVYTRSGKRDLGLVEIIEEAKQLPTGFVFDCECVAMGDFSDNIALRQASASILNRGSSQAKTGVQALCFDVLPIKDYDEGLSRLNAVGRKALVAHLLGDEASVDKLIELFPRWAKPLKGLVDMFESTTLKHIKPLPILGVVSTKEDGVRLAEPIWETGGEGVMLVEATSPYEVNPNPRKTLLKIKATTEYTLPCIGVYEGDNKYTGMLGGIEVGYTVNGTTYRVGVGSGFADYQRAEYWAHPERIVGKLVEIECFGASTNAKGGYSLNCPIFKRVVGDVD